MDKLRILRDRLLESIDRWSPEIVSAPPRSTLRFGIAQKCYSQIDKMLEASVNEAVQQCGHEGIEAVKVCGGEKPTNRLTLGERVQILEKLQSSLNRVLRNGVTKPGPRIVGPSLIKLLHRLSKDRNKFTHDDSEIDPATVTELLALATEFCESKFINAVIDLQENRRTIDGQTGSVV